jgi:hypothetical protein
MRKIENVPAGPNHKPKIPVREKDAWFNLLLKIALTNLFFLLRLW